MNKYELFSECRSFLRYKRIEALCTVVCGNSRVWREILSECMNKLGEAPYIRFGVALHIYELRRIGNSRLYQLNKYMDENRNIKNLHFILDTDAAEKIKQTTIDKRLYEYQRFLSETKYKGVDYNAFIQKPK